MKKNRLVLGVSIITVSAITLFGCGKNTEIKVDKAEEFTGVPIEQKSDKYNIDNLVKDASYTYGNLEGKSYSGENAAFDGDVSLKSIIVPYINISSEDAKVANYEIKGIFEAEAKGFEKELNSVEKKGYHIASYSRFINNDTLSVIISTNDTDGIQLQEGYYAYNFNLISNRKMGFKQIYEEAGLTEENINTKVNEAITKYFTDEVENTANNIPQGRTIEQYIAATIKNYEKAVKNNTLVYYLDAGSNLELAIESTSPLFDGNYIIITVSK